MALPSLPTTAGLQFCKTRAADSLWQRFAHRLTDRLVHQVFQRLTGKLGGHRYLLKPRRSAGGVGIAWSQADGSLDKNHYLQQYITGTPCSAVFHADGWSASLMGVTEQLVGDADFGAAAFRHCGSLGPIILSEQARAALAHLAVQLTQRFDVRGIFGVDLIMDADGTLWPIEVNPRYVASIEVIERALSLPLLAHLENNAAHGHGRKRQAMSRQGHRLRST